MGWAAAIQGLLIALPEIMRLIRDVLNLFERAFGPDPKEVVKKMGEIRRWVKEAKTQEEAQDAAKRLNDIIRGQ